MGGKRKAKTKRVNVRLDDFTFNSLQTFSNLSFMSMTSLIELALYDLLMKYVKSDTEIDGIKIKEIATLRKQRILRETLSLKRNEFMSKELFMIRVKRDIFKLLLYKRKEEDIIQKIKLYIDLRKEEAKFYVDNEELFKQLELYENEMECDVQRLKDLIYIQNKELGFQNEMV